MQKTTRTIAFFLPQFHPTPENDEWWGKGFTEWTNVAKAKPLFRDHYQPHIPADLGFYDLRLPDVRKEQAALAKHFGIEGFCYYHYWFAGRRMLERPLQEILDSQEPNFPFCVCWANHSWSGTWKGKSDLIFIEQTYPGMEDHELHFKTLLPMFQDPRYMRIDNKPIFVIFRPKAIPDVSNVINFWRKLANDAGLPGIYFIGINVRGNWSPDEGGFDASITDRLNASNGYISWRYPWLKLTSLLGRKLPTIYSYKDAADDLYRKNITPHDDYPCVYPNWDNSPRFGNKALILQGATPRLFRKHLRKAISLVENNKDDKKIIFIKAWNEWAEGNHLEPDLKFGTQFLEVIQEELEYQHNVHNKNGDGP